MGNKIEMEITQLVEKNPTLLRLGLHLEYNDARHRIATHLQRNIDTSKYHQHNKNKFIQEDEKKVTIKTTTKKIYYKQKLFLCVN